MNQSKSHNIKYCVIIWRDFVITLRHTVWQMLLNLHTAKAPFRCSCSINCQLLSNAVDYQMCGKLYNSTVLMGIIEEVTSS